ncbi:MAG: hypothetical protein IPK97_18955 [Ahniella sp.]|nr:hypothetical protein [Ahniella sp.]
MVERGQNVRLPTEAAALLVQQSAAHQLDCPALDRAVDLTLAKQHRAHAAAAEFADDVPGADPASNWGVHGLVEVNRCKSRSDSAVRFGIG